MTSQRRKIEAFDWSNAWRSHSLGSQHIVKVKIAHPPVSLFT